MHKLPDSAIVEKAKDGDRKAFRSIVERHQSMLFSLACRFLSKEEAKDAVQETFIRLWKNLHNYRPGVKLSTWLYRITTNFCLDQLKARRRRKWFKMVDIHQTYDVQDPSTPYHELTSSELAQAVMKMAENLTPKQRAVFTLRDLEGLSSTEVGEILSMKAGNVKSNLYYARLKIHEQLKQHYDIPKKRLTDDL